MSSSENISVTSISIKNAFGIRDAQITPGRVTLVSAQNGQGKTSLIRSIENATDGGSSLGLLNRDSDSGEVTLVLSDDTTIRKTFNKKSTVLQVTKDGKKISSPQNFLNELTSSMGSNPLKLLTASKPLRHKIFMDSLPIAVGAKDLSAIAGMTVDVSGKHGIEVIDDLYQSFYQKRRDANREVLRIEKSIESCQKVIDGYNPEDTADLETELEMLNESKSQIELKMQQECSDAMSDSREKIASLESKRSMAQAKIGSVADKYENKRLKVERELSEAIENLKAAAAVKIQDINNAYSKDVESEQRIVNECSEGRVRELRASAESACQKIKLDRGERLSEIRTKLASVEAELKSSSRVEPILEEIISFKDELSEANEEVGALQNTMDNILSYKIKLLSELNLEWFDYKDKQIFIDGVEFELVNTARLIQVAIELARLQSPRLRLLCVDGLESLDAKNFKLLAEEAEKSDMNLIVTKVDNNEGIEITSLDGSMKTMESGASNYAH